MARPDERREALEATQSHAPSLGSGADETVKPSETEKEAEGFAAPGFGPPAQQGEVGTLGPYRIVKELGRGGMGAVYAAVDTRLDRRLALKVMLPRYAADVEAKERFLREARAAAKVSHDNVVTIYEADERDGVAYIAMQFLQGLPLDQYLKKKGNPSLPQVVRIAREAAAGLAAAHRIGLVHRDIKPGNLWLEAPNGRVKVLDFGLAKPLDADVELTKSGAIVGTPAYMAPEQARGLKVDHRVDLFSLGVMLYRLCTGRLPFQGPSTMAVLMALGTEEPTPVRSLSPKMPDRLAELIHQLLAKKPEQRPTSAAEVVKRLREIGEQMGRATAPDLENRPATSVPAAVSVPASDNPFADLTTEQKNESDNPFAEVGPARIEASRPRSIAVKSEAPPPKKPISRAALAAGFLLPALLVGIIIIIRTKDGKQTKLDVPTGTKVTIREEKGEPVVNIDLDEKKSAPIEKTSVETEPKPALAAMANPDFKAISWVLANGGWVELQGNAKVWPGTPVPPEPTLMTVATFKGGKLNNDELGILVGCKALAVIDFHAAPLTDQGLTRLSGCSVTRLALGATQVTNGGLGALKDLPKLEHLDLSGSPATDRGLAVLQTLPTLKSIVLAGARVTDASVSEVVKATKLSEIQLVNTHITGEGLKLLARHPALKVIRLHGNKIGDAGLKSLAAASNLTKLELIDEAATPAGIDAFHAAVTGCRVLQDGRLVHDGRTAPTTPVVDPDRRAADWALALGGKVWLNGAEQPLTASSVLPVVRFALTGVEVKGPKVTDETLAVLKDCRRLTRLRLTRTRVTNEGLAQLAHLGSLDDLSLMGAPVTDAVFDNLKDCPITGLELNFTNISDEGMARVKRYKQLHGLGLSFSRVGDAGLEHLRGLKELRTLNVSRQPITAKGVAALKDLPGLDWVNLSATPLDDAAMQQVAELRQVRLLVVRDMNITDGGLKRLHAATQFEEIILGGLKITETGVAALRAALPRCTVKFEPAIAGAVVETVSEDRSVAEWVLSKGGTVTLKLEDKEQEVSQATQLPSGPFTLVGVNLDSAQPIVDKDLERLGSITSLTVLNLRKQPVGDAGMVYLRSLVNLTSMSLDRTKVGDAGLTELKALTKMAALGLWTTPITNLGLQHLAALTELRELYIGGTAIGDDGLRSLKPLTKLTHLGVNQTAVTDRGLDELRGLGRLIELHVGQTKVTADGVKAFSKRTPGCQIIWDGGTMEPKK